jgi:hypothetical protein
MSEQLGIIELYSPPTEEIQKSIDLDTILGVIKTPTNDFYYFKAGEIMRNGTVDCRLQPKCLVWFTPQGQFATQVSWKKLEEDKK